MNRGVSLYLTIIIMSILLAIVLGLSAILVGQMKMLKGMENSVIAFYAADTGIEEVLMDMDDPTSSCTEDDPCSLDNGANYYLEIDSQTVPGGVCGIKNYNIKSNGGYKGTKRAIEVIYSTAGTVQRYEFYADSNTGTNFGDTLRRAQTFTPNQSHTITKVRLRLFAPPAGGIVAGDINVSIQGVDGAGHPNGIDLCTGSISTAVLIQTPNEYEIILAGASCQLNSGTQYAIVVSASDSSFDALAWSVNQGAGAYGGGNAEVNLGVFSPWQSILNDDHVFEEWGCPI